MEKTIEEKRNENSENNQTVRVKKGYRKSEELINFANKKLIEIETKTGMKLSGFSELYENLSKEDQLTFMELLKASEEEQYTRERHTKHQCARKRKPRKNIKHGNRKNK
jgi:hypothetical protein